MKFHGGIIFLGCEDLEVIRSFYGDFLDLSLFKDQGSCLIYNLPGGDYLGFCNHLEEAPRDEKAPLITLLCENRSEVDVVYENFVEADIVLESEPSDTEEFKIYNFFARDPEGNMLEIQTFLD